ncbi:MAG TPA: glycosyltransferase family 39 protein [Vicinamibacterales bacterium]
MPSRGTIIGWLAILLAVLTTVAGARWNTNAASGSDSYGYVSQADLWLAGHLRIEQPWALDFAWQDVDWTVAPIGYHPVPGRPRAVVPIYSPGLPLLMALGKLLAGPTGLFMVVPLLGGLAVWLTYRFGAHLVDHEVALAAAALLATSPAFLNQLMWPMSDVPVTAWWMLVLLLVLGGARRRFLYAGLAASVALLIRPNLVPIAAVVALAAACSTHAAVPATLSSSSRAPVRDRVVSIALFVLGTLPGVLMIAALDWYWHGGPLQSGYAPFDQLYKLRFGPENLVHYAGWLWDTQTPLVLLAPIAFFLPGVLPVWDRHPSAAVSPRVLLAGVMVAVAACYVFYVPFGHWSFVRFLLPAYPAMLIASVATLAWVLRPLPARSRSLVIVLVTLAVMGFQVKVAADRFVFLIGAEEQRAVLAAHRVAVSTPPNAMILSMQHSGSLRYYSGRKTIRWDFLMARDLDAAVAAIRARGYRPYIALDAWERPRFEERFAGWSALGNLDNVPRTELVRNFWLFQP